MKDKHGVELVVGDKVTDIHNIIGEIISLNGCYAIYFKHKGKEYTTYEYEVINNQISKIEL